MTVLQRASLVAFLTLASCERTPTKSDYVRSRVTTECADQTGDAFSLCRLEVIKKYMDASLEDMQKHFPPPPPPKSRLACSSSD